MALQYTSIFLKPFLWLCVLTLASSCEIKYSSEVTSTDEKEKSIADLSKEACDCFSKQKGDVDTRLTLCTKSITYSQKVELPEGYSRQDSIAAANDIKTKMDSMKSRELERMSSMMQNLVVSCDAYGAEIEALYDKWYPIDSSATNIDSIKILDSKFRMLAISDTARKAVLHKLISKNIEARRLEEGLRRCQQMKQLFKNEGGAYYASAFIYNLQKKYPEAISELKQEISISGDKNLELIVAVMKRKAQNNK
ncbi:tetratricopeptide (TPR) repeat protein [Hymenobacter sp. UYAg731]